MEPKKCITSAGSTPASEAIGLSLSTLFFMLFSLPARGGAVGPEFVPSFYHAVEQILPSHAALQALRGSLPPCSSTWVPIWPVMRRRIRQ